MKLSKTFRQKLILYNLFLIVCIALAITFYTFQSYRKDVIHTETENSLNRISSLSSSFDIAYTEMVNILLSCAERNTSILSSSSYKNQDDTFDNAIAVYSADVLRDFCAISGYSKYIYKIIFYNRGLLLQAGTSSGSLSDPETIIAQPWFRKNLEKINSQYELSLVDNPFSINPGPTPKLLPLIRPIQKAYGDKLEESWVFLGISPALFTDTLNTMPRERILYTTTREGDVVATLNGDRFYTEDLTRELLDRPEYQGSFQTTLDREACIITYEKKPISGLLVYEVLPISAISLDHQVIFSTIMMIFFFCIAIGLTLSFFISKQLSNPISRLTERLKLISGGDFTRDSAIETDDEIGVIGKQINQMSGHISTLLDTRVQDEKEKKDMEIKMLQAQINPHFLYNTLDSIKWIATMQKNTGIVQVVTALSSLLKNMAKGFNEKVTFRQELDFLQNYVTIEKIRYIELFDVEIQVEEESLYDARIVKLTLQPIVENAIFSGIEPSGRFGLIQIHAFARDGVFYVTVQDNGVGISPENIEKLLTDTSRITKSNMSGIGLPNVDRRLKLVYGDDYGITIESELDQYTMITISLPLEYE